MKGYMDGWMDAILPPCLATVSLTAFIPKLVDIDVVNSCCFVLISIICID